MEERLNRILETLQKKIDAQKPQDPQGSYQTGYDDAEFTALDEAREIIADLLEEIRCLEEN